MLKKRIFPIIVLSFIVLLGFNNVVLAEEEYGIIYAENISLEWDKWSFNIVIDIIEGEEVGAIGLKGIRYDKDKIKIDSIDVIEEKMRNWDNPVKEKIFNQFGLASVEYGRSAIATDPQEVISGKVELVKVSFTVIEKQETVFPIEFDLNYADWLFFLKDGDGLFLSSMYNFFNKIVIEKEGVIENNIKKEELKTREELVQIVEEKKEEKEQEKEKEKEEAKQEELKKTVIKKVKSVSNSSSAQTINIKSNKEIELDEPESVEVIEEEILENVGSEKVGSESVGSEKVGSESVKFVTDDIKAVDYYQTEKKVIRTEGDFIRIQTDFVNKDNKEVEYRLISEDLDGFEVTKEGILEGVLPVVTADQKNIVTVVIKEKWKEKVLYEEKIEILVLNQIVKISGVLKTLGSNEIVDGEENKVIVYSEAESIMATVNKQGEFSLEINSMLTKKLEVLSDSYEKKIIKLPIDLTAEYVLTDDDENGDQVFNDENKLHLKGDFAVEGEWLVSSEDISFVEYKNIKTLATCYVGEDISRAELVEKCGEDIILFNKIKVSKTKPDGKITRDDGDRLLLYFLVKNNGNDLWKYLIEDFQ